jgi:cytochrome c-type protein NapC
LPTFASYRRRNKRSWIPPPVQRATFLKREPFPRRVAIVPSPTALLYLLIGVSILSAAFLIARPTITLTRGGKELAFVALFLLPVVVASMGAAEHMQRSEQTQFCLSCHIMEPYGKSLLIDDPGHVPAAHFQNGRIPRDQACYTCHTDYVMYGTVLDKIRGLRHVYVQYLGHAPSPIRLYSPFNNRECLHCHAGSRSFEEGAVHNADPSIMASIKSNALSCMSSGCHQNVHDVAHLGEMKSWTEPK